MKNQSHRILSFYWLVLLWLLVVGGSITSILSYESIASANHTTKAQWPANSSQRLNPKVPTLVMFLHPLCPCSLASIRALERLHAKTFRNLDIHVIGSLAQSGSTLQSPLMKTAGAIPGILVASDNTFEEARCFGATTSGETFLFDIHGTLRFHGGMTQSRGHEGDSDGTKIIEQLILSDPSSKLYASTPVYGCPLSCEVNE